MSSATTLPQALQSCSEPTMARFLHVSADRQSHLGLLSVVRNPKNMEVIDYCTMQPFIVQDDSTD